jgi:hypothetical protein
MNIHPLDRVGTCERVPRSQISTADFNPRTITPDQRRRLKVGLETHGLCSPLVWNKTSGRIVGGHQRLAILDSLSADKDWPVPVTVQELTEERERELNLLLNNQEAMGSYDLTKLGSMFHDFKLDIAATGFDAGKLKTLIPELAISIPDIASKIAENKQHWQDNAQRSRDKQDAAYTRIAERSQSFTPQTSEVEKPGDKHEQQILDEDDLFYLVFIYDSLMTAGRVKELMGLPVESRDLDGRVLLQILNEWKELKN